MNKCLLLFILHFSLQAASQQADYYHIKKDSTGFELTVEGASFLASLPLKCLQQEYPNKINHTAQNDSDQVLTPHQMHPAFYGCFDWHSSVHGHWMLIRLLKMFPQLPEANQIRSVLNTTLTPSHLKMEAQYFDAVLARGWERTYGWAWLLKLDQELYGWNDPDAFYWHRALQPLTQKIIELWTQFLPKQTYPNRTGVHPNTAFGMAMALDFARTEQHAVFASALEKAAKQIFYKDRHAPSTWEPDGSDFLSPSLEEADLMQRVLPVKEFLPWLNNFLGLDGLKHLSNIPIVSDRKDLQIVHLDGLCFSRSWCMRGLAAALPKNDPRKKLLIKSAFNHLAAALPNVVSGNYGGEHWLASFAVKCITE